MAKARPKLGELLIARRLLDRAGLKRGLATQHALGNRLGTALLELGLVEEDRLLDTLAAQLQVPAASADALRRPAAEVLALVPAKMATRHRVVPVRTLGGRLQIAMQDPWDLGAQDEISFVAGRPPAVHVALEVRLAEALERHYAYPLPRRITLLLDRLNRSRYLWREGDDGAADLGDPAADLFPAEPRLAPPPLPEPESPYLQAVPAPAGPEPEDRLITGGSRDEVGRALLDGVLADFSRAGLFAIQGGRVLGWMGGGEGFDPERLARFELPLDRPSVFLNLHRGSAFHLGLLAPMPAHVQLSRCWRSGRPAEALLMPIRIGERLIAVLYADRGKGSLGGVDLPRVQRLTGLAAAALERCIVLKKQRQTTTGRR